MHHPQDILGHQRLKIEVVGHVKVGADGLGVVIDHHRRDAHAPQSLQGMDAATVKLNPLANPDGAAAHHHHGALPAGGLVRLAQGGIEVAGLAGKLRAASVHHAK